MPNFKRAEALTARDVLDLTLAIPLPVCREPPNTPVLRSDDTALPPTPNNKHPSTIRTNPHIVQEVLHHILDSGIEIGITDSHLRSTIEREQFFVVRSVESKHLPPFRGECSRQDV